MSKCQWIACKTPAHGQWLRLLLRGQSLSRGPGKQRQVVAVCNTHTPAQTEADNKSILDNSLQNGDNMGDA